MFHTFGGVKLSPLVLGELTGPSYPPLMINGRMGIGGMIIGRGNQSTRRRSCPIAILLGMPWHLTQINRNENPIIEQWRSGCSGVARFSL
jgi:hypothetical protein